MKIKCFILCLVLLLSANSAHAQLVPCVSREICGSSFFNDLTPSSGYVLNNIKAAYPHIWQASFPLSYPTSPWVPNYNTFFGFNYWQLLLSIVRF